MSAASLHLRASSWLPFERGEPVRNIALFEIAAGVIGVLWYLAIVVVPGRFSPFQESSGAMNAKDHLLIASCFIATSLAVSTAFRSPIRRSSSWWMVALGTSLMFVGAALFMLGFALVSFALDPVGSGWKEIRVGDFFVLPLAGVMVAAMMFYVTIPMGIASVFALRWADRWIRRRSARVG